MWKPKLKEAKHTRKNETYTEDSNEQAKVNTKRLPRKQRREIGQKVKQQKAKKKKVLHLDSTPCVIFSFLPEEVVVFANWVTSSSMKSRTFFTTVL